MAVSQCENISVRDFVASGALHCNMAVSLPTQLRHAVYTGILVGAKLTAIVVFICSRYDLYWLLTRPRDNLCLPLHPTPLNPTWVLLLVAALVVARDDTVQARNKNNQSIFELIELDTRCRFFMTTTISNHEGRDFSLFSLYCLVLVWYIKSKVYGF